MLDPSKGRGGSGGGGGAAFAGNAIGDGNMQGFLESLHGQMMLRLDQMALQQAEQSKQVMDRLEELVSSAITKSMYGTNGGNGALFRQGTSNNDLGGRISPDALASTLGKNRMASPSRLELKRLNSQNSQSPDSPVRGTAPSASSMAAAAANELLGGDATWSPWSPGGTAAEAGRGNRVQPQKQAVATHGASPPIFLDEAQGALEDTILADVEKTRCLPASPSEQSGVAGRAWASPRTAGDESKKGISESSPRDPPLFVTILSAKNLRNSRGMPANDPFCICRARGGTEFRTHPRRDTADTLNPIWECEVALEEYTWGENIELLVYDDLSSIGGTKELLCSTVLTPDRFGGEGRPSTPAAVKFSGELPLLRPRTNFAAGSTINIVVSMDAAEPSPGGTNDMIEVPSAEEEEKSTWRFRGLRTLSAAAARMVDPNTASSTAQRTGS